MALAVAKTWSARTTGAASLTVNLTAAAISAGDLLHVETSLFDTVTLTCGAPTDSAGNTYHQPAGANNDSGWSSTFRSIIGSAYTVVGTAPTSVVVKKATGGSSTQDIAGVVCHVTGADQTSPLDQANANHVASSSAPAHTAMTTTSANDVLFCGLTHDGGNITCTKPTGFTQGETNGNGATGEPYADGYEIVSAIQTAFAPAWALSGAANIGLCFTSYKTASGGGGGTTIMCSAIPSSEAWGKPTVRRIARALAIATAEAFGTPIARRVAVAAGVPTTEAWGIPTVQRVARATSAATSESFGTPTVRRIVVEQPFASSETWGKPLVQGGIYPNIIVVSCYAVASAELWGLPTVRRVLRAQQITTAEQFGTAILQRVARTPAAASTEAWGTPTVRRIVRAAAAASGEQWGIPTVRRSITALNISTGEAWGIVLVQGGTVVVTPFQPGQIQLADIGHVDVFVADGETWAIGVADLARFDIKTGDRPGG